VTRLRQLTALRVAQTNQRRLVSDPDVLASVEEVTAVLTRHIRALEAKIAGLIDADPLWSRLDETFRSIKGVAGRTVAGLMAEIPEIGTLTGKQIAKLVASPRSPATRARSQASALSGPDAAPDAAPSARCCSWSPAWCAAMTRTSPPSMPS
jgi:transposase